MGCIMGFVLPLAEISVLMSAVLLRIADYGLSFFSVTHCIKMYNLQPL